MNKNIPKRNSKKYLRIEKYEDYEFTHCIAYEMAIRNKEVIKLTNIIENLNILNAFIQNLIPNEYKLKMSQEVLSLRNFNHEEDVSNILDRINNLKSKMDNLLVENLATEQLNYIVKSFDKIINKYKDDYLLNIINRYNSKNFDLFSSDITKNSLFEIFHNVSSIEKINIILILSDSIEQKLEKEYYVVNEQQSITPKKIKKDFPKDTNYEPNEALSNHIDSSLKVPHYKDEYNYGKGYISFQGGFENDDSFSINEVIPNFSQPLRMFNTMKVSINPSLPLNDILSFVKQIKEDYDKNETFKSFFELIEEDFNNSENTTITKKIKLDKSKWADVFYVYDYFKFRKNTSNTIYDIMEELSFQLTFYYNNLHNKTNPNNLKPTPENLTDGKLDFENFSYTKKDDFGNELYLSADHIRKFHYKKISSLIEGENPEYKKLIAGKNHNKNSLIDGKNNVSSGL